MEGELEVSIDTSEVDNASTSAEQSAQSANEAAARAEAAAVNQGQLIETVTAYAREDAREAAAEANASAANAEAAAEFAISTKDQFLAEVTAVLEPLMLRVQQLESSRQEAPVVVQSNQPEVTPIDPQSTEQEEQEEHQEPEAEPPATGGRRRHGRRRR